MRYYLDCEFNGLGGELLSLALEPEHDRPPLYLVRADIDEEQIDPWVFENVLPLLHADGGYCGRILKLGKWPVLIEAYLQGDPDITIVTDWPDDIKYFCDLIITGPGRMIEIRPSLKFEMHRIDAYPTEVLGAVQHCAYWDAKALKAAINERRDGGV